MFDVIFNRFLMPPAPVHSSIDMFFEEYPLIFPIYRFFRNIFQLLISRNWMLHNNLYDSKPSPFWTRVALFLGADPYAIDCNHQPMLVTAATVSPRCKLVGHIFFEYCANMNVKNQYGESLIWAILYRPEFLRLVIQKGGNIHERHQELYQFFNLGREQVAQKVDPQWAGSTDTLGSTLLHRAAFYGSAESAKILIENGADVNALGLLATRPNVQIVRRVTPLEVAVAFGEIEVIKVLLGNKAVTDHPEIGRMLAANENRSLLEAASKGDLPLVEKLLSYPEVLQNVTVFENVILRGARNNEHWEVVDRLMAIDAVRNFVRPNVVRTVAETVENPENALLALTSEQEGILATVSRHYKDAFQAMGHEVGVLDNYRLYLEAQYLADPAKDEQGAPLPLQYQATLQNQEPYYRNIYHTAWRYFFCRPNPWMSPLADYVDEVDDGLAANISVRDKRRFAYMWLAASSADFTPTEGFTHEGIKHLFTHEIAYVARAHNYDENERDEYSEGDRPSCQVGVTRRLVQSVLGNPITQIDKSLTPESFKRRFVTELVSENTAIPNNLYAKLKRQTRDTLAMLKEIIEKHVIELNKLEDLSSDEQAILHLLNIEESELSTFIQSSKIWFETPENWDQKVIWQDHSYQSYEDFANGLALNIVDLCGDVIIDLLNGLTERRIRMAS